MRYFYEVLRRRPLQWLERSETDGSEDDQVGTKNDKNFSYRYETGEQETQTFTETELKMYRIKKWKKSIKRFTIYKCINLNVKKWYGNVKDLTKR